MRIKFSVDRFDDKRVLVYPSNGFKPTFINTLKSFANKEKFFDVEIATLDDDRIGVVCKPTSFFKFIQWNRTSRQVPVMPGLEWAFLEQCSKVLKEGMEHTEYKEPLSKKEKEIRKRVKEEVDKLPDNKDEDKTWEKQK